MRLSFLRTDPGYSGIHAKGRIFLDGIERKDALIGDTDLGELTVYARNERGHLFTDKETLTMQTTVLRGVVTITE